MLEQPIKAEPPREMSRDDRRVIFSKINDVYIDEKRGYDSGWNDQKIADDLGVPRAWVKSIREENFGTEGASEDVLKITATVKSTIEELQNARDFFAGEIAGAGEVLSKFDARLSRLHAEMRALEKRFK